MIVYLNAVGAAASFGDFRKYIGLPIEARKSPNGLEGLYNLYDLKGCFISSMVSPERFSKDPPGVDQVLDACDNYRKLMHYDTYPGRKRRAVSRS